MDRVSKPKPLNPKTKPLSPKLRGDLKQGMLLGEGVFGKVWREREREEREREREERDNVITRSSERVSISVTSIATR